MLKPVLFAAAIALLAAPTMAGEAGDLTRDALYAGDLAGGLSRIEPLQATGGEAKFGKGLLSFVAGVEGLAQALYRHGVAAPETPALLGGGVLGIPVPANPNPEPLDYARVRDILSAFRDGLDAASGIFEAAGAAGDYVVPIDLGRIRIDANGDGRAEENEGIVSVFMSAFGMSQAGAGNVAPPAAPPDLTIGFDRADAFWLAGYSQVFAAQAEFLLAHDFEDFVNTTFHRIFPRAGLPMQDYADGGSMVFDPGTDGSIADAIAGIHALSWPVDNPAMLANVLQRFKKITALSRRNWDAILAESDDVRELVPSPTQTSIVPDGRVTGEVVAAWLETLDVADKVLAGDLLVPHWRFRQGFDLPAYFNTARRTDLVMLLTGYDAVAYLKDGPIADAASFAAANRVFGNEFLGYVFWFN